MSEAAKILAALEALQADVSELKARLAERASPAPVVEPYVDASAVMERYGISRPTLCRWQQQGCPYEQRGAVVRFKLSAVEAWYSQPGRKLRRVK